MAARGRLVAPRGAGAAGVGLPGVGVAGAVGGDLKHDLKHGATYLEVQTAGHTAWKTALVDADPETRIRVSVVKHGLLDQHHYLNVTISATLQEAGTYRVLYHGNAYKDGAVTSFLGTSSNFTVL